MLIHPATICGSDTPSQGQAEARRVESSSTAYVDPRGITGSIQDRLSPREKGKGEGEETVSAVYPLAYPSSREGRAGWNRSRVLRPIAASTLKQVSLYPTTT